MGRVRRTVMRCQGISDGRSGVMLGAKRKVLFVVVGVSDSQVLHCVMPAE
jgi:hypothetical protein